MTLSPYAKYRSTGIGWLGEIPEHWTVRRLGYFFNERREKVSDKDFLPLSVTKKGIVPQLETAAKSDDGDNRKKVCAGDFVINSRSDRKGSAGISPCEGSVSLINTILQPTSSVSSQFIEFLLKSVDFQEEYYRFGHGIVADLWTTRYSEMRNISLAWPSRSEQNAIADFLSRETIKIDQLIEQQIGLVRLLEEKRRAIISHAVTKGLDGNAPVRPSGLNWLGNVPEHWTSCPLNRISLSKCDGPFGSGLKTEHYTGHGARVIRLQNICMGFFDDSDGAFVDVAYATSQLKKHEVRENDLLVAGLGDDNNAVGRACVAPRNIEPAIVKADCFRFRLDALQVVSEFIALQLTVSSSADAGRLSSGSTRSRISLYKMASRVVCFPSIDEQEEICDFIRAKCREIDSLLKDAADACALLRERRIALISAAVKGKINTQLGLAEAKPSNDNAPSTLIFAETVNVLSRDSRRLTQISQMKAIFLTEVHLGYSDGIRDYDRKLAGPHNRSVMERGNEAGTRNKWFLIEQDGWAQRYRPGEKHGQHSTELLRVFGEDKTIEIQRMTNLLNGLDNSQLEVCATLYHCWLLRLDKNLQVDDADLVADFESYSPRKQNFTRLQIRTGLQWLQRNEITPSFRRPYSGYSNYVDDHTQHNLF